MALEGEHSRVTVAWTDGNLGTTAGDAADSHCWSWLRESPSAHSVAKGEGLRIRLQPGGLWGEFGRSQPARNTLLCGVPSDAGAGGGGGGEGIIARGIEVTVACAGESFGEQAGLVLYGDDDNYAKLVLECMKDGTVQIVFAAELGGEPAVVSKTPLPRDQAVAGASPASTMRLEWQVSGPGTGTVAALVNHGFGLQCVGSGDYPALVSRDGLQVGVMAHGGTLEEGGRVATFRHFSIYDVDGRRFSPAQLAGKSGGEEDGRGRGSGSGSGSGVDAGSAGRAADGGRAASQPSLVDIFSAHGAAKTARQTLSALAECDEAGEPATPLGNGCSPDVYGSGATLQAFEAEVAALMGKEAGVFVVSGVMAQLIATRLHCTAVGRNTVTYHVTSHLEVHENMGIKHVMGITSSTVGAADVPLSADDVIAAADAAPPGEAPAVIIVELPQRHSGGATTAWDDLVRLRAWADSQSPRVRLHMDGARLWEVQPRYGKTFADICALFDSVYVSFYKGVGALAGAMLVGTSELVADARVWLRRMGGNLITVMPYEVSARRGFHELVLGGGAATTGGATGVPGFKTRYDKLVRVVAAITKEVLEPLIASGTTPPFEFFPAVPQSSMIHVRFRRGLAGDELVALANSVASTAGYRLFKAVRPVFGTADGEPTPQFHMEWNMGPANLALDDTHFVAGWRAFAQAAPPASPS